jgi:hypothetical protein
LLRLDLSEIIDDLGLLPDSVIQDPVYHRALIDANRRDARRLLCSAARRDDQRKQSELERPVPDPHGPSIRDLCRSGPLDDANQ